MTKNKLPTRQMTKFHMLMHNTAVLGCSAVLLKYLSLSLWWLVVPGLLFCYVPVPKWMAADTCSDCGKSH